MTVEESRHDSFYRPLFLITYHHHCLCPDHPSPYYDKVGVGGPLIRIIDEASLIGQSYGACYWGKGSTVDRSLRKGVYYSVSIHMNVHQTSGVSVMDMSSFDSTDIIGWIGWWGHIDTTLF
eukprot:6213241-Pleurochrysis_carterae.AAC.1